MQVEKKKERVQNMFNNIAHKYDFLNRFFSLGIDTLWRKRLVKQVAKLQADKILDLASGTGDLAIALSKTIPQAQIIGADISENMLAIARQKVIKKGLQSQIQLEIGDAEYLKYEDKTFDLLTVAFGVRNYEHLLKGLSEMQRVTKLGGHVFILEFSKPKIFPIKQLYHFYFTSILPFFGKLISKNKSAYSYLPQSVQAFPDGQDFIEILEQAGYSHCQQQRLSFGIASIYSGKKV